MSFWPASWLASPTMEQENPIECDVASIVSEVSDVASVSAEQPGIGLPPAPAEPGLGASKQPRSRSNSANGKRSRSRSASKTRSRSRSAAKKRSSSRSMGNKRPRSKQPANKKRSKSLMKKRPGSKRPAMKKRSSSKAPMKKSPGSKRPVMKKRSGSRSGNKKVARRVGNKKAGRGKGKMLRPTGSKKASRKARKSASGKSKKVAVKKFSKMEKESSKVERSPRKGRSLAKTQDGVMMCATHLAPAATFEGVKFNRWIKQVLQDQKTDVHVGRDSLNQMDAVMKNVLHHIATNAADKMGKRKTMSEKQMKKALKSCVRPGPLRDSMLEKADNAMKRYKDSKRSRLLTHADC